MIEHKARDQRRCLHLRPLSAPLKEWIVLEPSQSSLELVIALNVLVDWDELKGLVQVEVLELGARVGKVFSLIHAVVLLILIAVQIRDSPVCLVLGSLSILVLSMLDKLLSNVLPLYVFF